MAALLAENGADRSIHPTQKPLRLMHHVLELVGQPGEVVLDPYAGTGTTLRAAKNLGYRAIGVEIDERYCDLAAQRCAQEVLELRAVRAESERTA